MKDGQLRSQFRIPVPLHERLTASAQRNGRSMNAEIIFRLEQTFSSTISEANVDADLKKKLEHAVSKSAIGRFLTEQEVHRIVDQMLSNSLPD